MPLENITESQDGNNDQQNETDKAAYTMTEVNEMQCFSMPKMDKVKKMNMKQFDKLRKNYLAKDKTIVFKK